MFGEKLATFDLLSKKIYARILTLTHLKLIF